MKMLLVFDCFYFCLKMTLDLLSTGLTDEFSSDRDEISYAF